MRRVDSVLIYRIDYHDVSEGDCIEWVATKKEGEPRVKELREIYSEITMQAVEFPRTKSNIAKWLNRHFKRDNG